MNNNMTELVSKNLCAIMQSSLRIGWVKGLKTFLRTPLLELLESVAMLSTLGRRSMRELSGSILIGSGGDLSSGRIAVLTQVSSTSVTQEFSSMMSLMMTGCCGDTVTLKEYTNFE